MFVNVNTFNTTKSTYTVKRLVKFTVLLGKDLLTHNCDVAKFFLDSLGCWTLIIYKFLNLITSVRVKILLNIYND